jgi:carbon monoxide dehydrogenase subunit G
VIVSASYAFPGRREAVWGMLLDPELIQKTMPGVQRMVRGDDGRYLGRMRVGVGPILSAEFDVSVTLADVLAPERYTMLIDGRGRLGFARGRAQVRLAPDAAGSGTVMRFEAELEVGGAVAAVGQRLLDSVSRLIMRQGLESLHREVMRRLAAQGGPGAPP